MAAQQPEVLRQALDAATATTIHDARAQALTALIPCCPPTSSQESCATCPPRQSANDAR